MAREVETFSADSEEGTQIQKNALDMIQRVTKRGCELAEKDKINPIAIVGAAFTVWKAADELLDFDLDSERDEFEETCRGMCITIIELTMLPTTDEKMN